LSQSIQGRAIWPCPFFPGICKESVSFGVADFLKISFLIILEDHNEKNLVDKKIQGINGSSNESLMNH
jgi:hypothetical protein